MIPRDDDERSLVERLRALPPPPRRFDPPSPPNAFNPLDRRNSPYPWAVGVELASGHPLWAAITGLFWWFKGR